MNGFKHSLKYTLLFCIALQPTLYAMEEVNSDEERETLGVEDEETESLVENSKNPRLSPKQKSLVKKGTFGATVVLLVGGVITGLCFLPNPESNANGSSQNNSPSNPFESTSSDGPTCEPIKIPLNSVPDCSDDGYWEGAKMAEATLSGKCLPLCTSTPDKAWSSFRAPKSFICDQGYEVGESIINRMWNALIPYEWSGGAWGFADRDYSFFTYDSKGNNFTPPEQHFTVEEIEKNPPAMQIIQEYFEFEQHFNDDTCDQWELVEYLEPNTTSEKIPSKQQHQRKPRNKKEGKRSIMEW